MTNRLRQAAALLALAGIYLVAAKLGLRLAFVNASATAVWPATGIAIAACLLGGTRMWPGILLGAFLANLTTAGNLLTSVGIAAGNTLEGVAGAVLVRRFAGGAGFVDQPLDLFRFAALAGLVAPVASATIGVTSLALGGFAPWSGYGPIWLTWWLGDAAGALIATPTIVAWARGPRLAWTGRITEAVALAASLAVVGMRVFLDPGSWAGRRIPLEFLGFPFLVWAGLRFGAREASTATVGLVAMAIGGTLRGLGPFAGPDPNTSLLVLQTFSAVAMVMVLALTSAVGQYRVAELRARLANLDLERRVDERTAALQVANRELGAVQVRLTEAQHVGRIGSWEWDIPEDRIWWSDELYRLYGIEPSAAPLRYEAFLERVHPDDRDRAHAVVGAALASGEPFRYEHRLIRPDGRSITLEAHGRVERDRDGRPLRMLGTAQDIGARKVAEVARAGLARAEIARAEAEEANRVKDAFLATLSHELRTPLNAILGWTELLVAGVIDATEVPRAIETIRRNAHAQRRLISDILDLSAIESGKLALAAVPLDLAALIDAALDTVGPAAEGRKVTLVRQVDRGLPRMLGDPDRLQQVIWNLLSNAVKFVQPGGTVEVRLVHEDGRARIDVLDDGPGIPEELLPHVFDRFRQGDSSSTRRHRGLGLGLAIVQGLVESHGGTVRAANRTDTRGAVFTVELPLRPTGVDSAAPAAARGPADSGAPLRGVQVMIVDDDADSRAFVRRVLEHAGARVTACESTSDAASTFERDRPDVVVSDIEMPEEDGYALLGRLRELPGPAVRAVALTAYASREDVLRTRHAGFHSHVAKPVEPDALVRAVADAAAAARPINGPGV